MKLIIVATCANVVKMVGLIVRSHFVVSDLPVVINSPPLHHLPMTILRCCIGGKESATLAGIYIFHTYIHIYIETGNPRSRQLWSYKWLVGYPISGRVAEHSSANISPVTDVNTYSQLHVVKQATAAIPTMLLPFTSS